MDIDPFYGYRPDSITYPGGDRYPSRYCTPNWDLRRMAIELEGIKSYERWAGVNIDE